MEKQNNQSDDYIVIININTRFAVLKSMLNRATASVLIYLNNKSLESNEEASFVFKPVLKYRDKKNNDYYVITEEKHNNFSIIARFLKTLRDRMRTNRPMSDNTINKFIKTYNQPFNNSIEYHLHKCMTIKILKYSTSYIKSRNKINKYHKTT
jgi:hypothetical protein